MARIDGFTLRIGFSQHQLAAMRRSIECLGSVPVALDRLPDVVGGPFDKAFQFGDFCRIELSGLSTSGAHEACCAPGEGYLELVVAIADYFDLAITYDHGWPILSVGCGDTTVAEAGGGGNAPAAEAAASGQQVYDPRPPREPEGQA